MTSQSVCHINYINQDLIQNGFQKKIRWNWTIHQANNFYNTQLLPKIVTFLDTFKHLHRQET